MLRIFGKTLAIAVIAFNVFTGFAPDASARVILKERTTFYNVTGSNGREIFASIQKNGPRTGRGPTGGGHAIATTEYGLDLENVKLEVKNARCTVKNVDVVLKVKYTYPKWRGSSKARSTTRNAWKTFRRDVVWHEKQHVKIAMEYAEDYLKILKKTKLRASKECTELSLIASMKLFSAGIKTNRKQKKFDRRDLRRGGRGYQAQVNLFTAK